MLPTAPQERSQLLDVLRGLAILGMFMVNMTLDIPGGDALREAALGTLDFAGIVFVDLFANGKFITLFSFLFGIGFWMQSERARERGEDFRRIHLRRAGGLLAIGLAANALTLPAWILVDYAVFGLLLLPLRRLGGRGIIVVALVCFLISKLYGSVLPDVGEAREVAALAADQGVPVTEVVWPEDPADVALDEEEHRIFTSGTSLEISQLMLSHLWSAFTDPGYYLDNLDLLGIMLLGLWVARRGAVRDAPAGERLARTALPWLLGLGLAGCAVWTAMTDFGWAEPHGLADTVLRRVAFWPLGAVALGLGYAAALMLLLRNERWRGCVAVFAPVGRMALTNYLLTCLAVAAVTWPWGLGHYGGFSPALALVCVAAIFALQVAASRWWLGRFRYGPCEWLWRSLTYGRLPPMRLKTARDPV
jgi:uncharacterized protein